MIAYLIDPSPWETFEEGDGTRAQRHADSRFWHPTGPSHSFGFESTDGYDRKSLPIDVVEVEPYFASEATL